MPTRRFRSARSARFGDFELDIRAGELRREGVLIRLQEQPFRILAMLLEHPGEVVLRDEIRRRLWPNDTVVEIGHGINAAVLRLREALGESAGSPRYIETLPRRGYRFNGEVSWQSGPPVTIADGIAPADTENAEWTGRAVSHYRVLDRLGRGGMGVVYRAEDLNLGRMVALKFLSSGLVREREARERFQREARAASALNHPNVCTVYSVEEFAGQPVISMELVEGQTLASLLSQGQLPRRQALEMAVQVAAALDAAHRKGVVHRDLKPGNLMVNGNAVKVLDFGIAKMDREPLTGNGAVVGTPNYMSPEQLRGGEVDARTDIYSFGLVLFEALTGSPWTAGAALPPACDTLIDRCLREDPAARWQTAAELKAELERLLTPPVPRAKRTMPPLRWIAAAAALCAALAGASLMLHRPPDPVRFTLTGPEEASAVRLRLAPDGRSVAFASGMRHYVRAFDRRSAQLLTAPDGVGTPFWSPDGKALAISEGGGLVRVGLSPGSMPTTLARVNTNIEGAWGPDGTILIGLVNDGIYRIPAAGGALTRVTVPDAQRGETRHLVPQFLPGGRRFLYLAGGNQPGASALWAASLDTPEQTQVMPLQSNFAFVPFTPRATQGYLVYLRDRVLVAQPFDSGRLTLLGEPYALASAVNANPVIGATAVQGEFSATPAALVYRSGPIVTVVQNWMSEVLRSSRAGL